MHYRYDDVREWIVESTARLGPDYQAQVREAFERRWIDVYENQGKRSGAYSAPVYGAHPYMLLNYNDTLDAVFTLAHEMGHSMHTLLAHAAQPFVYAGYTIFVAEVPSTLNEELLLELMLERVGSREERIVLLQHAIDGIVGTFYNQVLFADFELEAHRMVERDEPITAEALSALYNGLLDAYWGDAITRDDRHGLDLGPHPALLPVAVLRLPVRDLHGLDGGADAGGRQRRPGAGAPTASTATCRCWRPAAATIRWRCSSAPASTCRSRRRSAPWWRTSTGSSIGSKRRWSERQRARGVQGGAAHSGSPLTTRSVVRSRTTGTQSPFGHTRAEKVAGSARTSTS